MDTTYRKKHTQFYKKQWDGGMGSLASVLPAFHRENQTRSSEMISVFIIQVLSVKKLDIKYELFSLTVYTLTF